MTHRFSTREEWLTAAISALNPMFTGIGAEVPEVRVSVGWPGGRGKKTGVIGQCWASRAAADEVPQIFISPALDEPTVILATLMHELVHAVDDCMNGHRGPFVRMIRALGLEGKPTATHAGPELQERLKDLATELGEYPHAALVATTGGKKQTTRMLKAECPEGSGYKVRLTRSWIEEYGAPICPHCQQVMVTG